MRRVVATSPARALAPYRVLARVKNNRLWSTILRQWPGVHTQRKAAERLKVSETDLGRLLNIRYWPWNPQTQTWTLLATQIAKRLRETEEYLFDPELYGRAPRPVLALEFDRPALEATGLLPLPAPAPDALVERTETKQALSQLLDGLPARERAVLVSRFGFDDRPEATLAEIGEAQGVTKERIRGIEANALRRLRHRLRTWKYRDVKELLLSSL